MIEILKTSDATVNVRETKEITSVISDVMSELGYERTFCEIVPNTDSTINRRMSRYRKNNVI